MAAYRLSPTTCRLGRLKCNFVEGSLSLIQAGFLIADGDSLEDTQEAGGHNGHAAENSKNIQKKVV